MDNLPFHDEELDLIWSEGAIYNIGFERGLNEWKKFLKKGGYVAVTEASWFILNRPEEIERFWMEAYPEIDTISRKVAIMEKAGYIPVAMFTPPEECWTEHFYAPHAAAQEKCLSTYAGNRMAKELVANGRREAQRYYKYKEFCGDIYYIEKKI